MATANIWEQMMDFNKKAFEDGFNVLNGISDQTEKAMETFLNAAPHLPENNKKAFRYFCENSNVGLKNWKKSVDAALKIKVGQKEATAQTLKVFEESVQDTFDLTSQIQEQNEELVSSLTKTFPKEGQEVLKVLNNTIDTGFESYKEMVNQNFVLANKMIKESSKKADKTDQK